MTPFVEASYTSLLLVVCKILKSFICILIEDWPRSPPNLFLFPSTNTWLLLFSNSKYSVLTFKLKCKFFGKEFSAFEAIFWTVWGCLSSTASVLTENSTYIQNTVNRIKNNETK